MAGTLVVAELVDGKVRKSTLSAITFAKQVGGSFAILAIGAGAAAAAKELAGFGAAKVIAVDDPALKDYVVERFAPTVAAVAKSGGFDTVVVTASSFGKDLAPRLAAKLGAGYAPDINAVKVDGGKRLYRRPTYAGNAFSWLEIATPIARRQRPSDRIHGGRALRGREPRRERRARGRRRRPLRGSSS